MINIYWDMTYDGNVNQSEEIPWLVLIQLRPPNRLRSSQKLFNLMKPWWHSSNILSRYWSPYCKFSILYRPVDTALFDSLPVCCVVLLGLGRCLRWWRALTEVINQSWHLDGNELSWRAHLSNNNIELQSHCSISRI